MEPSTDDVEVPSVLNKKVSQQNSKDEDRNNFRNFIKQHKRGSSDVEILVKPKGGDKYSYNPSNEITQENEVFEKKDEDIEQQKQSSKRTKKGWNKNPNAVIMPIKETSPQRKQWNVPTHYSDINEDEKFEVVNVEQEEIKDIDPAQQAYEYMKSTEEIPCNEEDKISENYDIDQKQYERMIKEMQDNLFCNNDETDDSTQDESWIDDKILGSPTFTALKASEPKVEELPDISNDDKDDREDFDFIEAEETKRKAEKAYENVSEAQMKNLTFGGGVGIQLSGENKVIGEKIDEDLTRYNTIERVRDYLEQEIGEEILAKAHPILKEFGDDILYENNIPLVIRKLEGILSRDEVMQYLHFFATLIFFEMEAERIAKKKMINNSEIKSKPEPVNLQSFKDIDMSIGNPENVFKNVPIQSQSYFTTAKFG